MNPFTGPEWEGWKISDLSGLGCWVARRPVAKTRRNIAIVVYERGEVILEIHQRSKPLWMDIDQTSVESALKSANAIAEAVGGWE